MIVQSKLKEAGLLLKKLYESQDIENRFKDNLNAFLSTIRSIPYHLLRDYGVRYGLHEPLTKKVHPEVFEEKAKQIGSEIAVNFIRWWLRKMDELKKDPIGSLLVGEKELDVTNIFAMPATVETKTKAVDSSIQKMKETGIKINWFFKEYDKEPVIIICEKFFSIIKKFVKEAEKTFPH